MFLNISNPVPLLVVRESSLGSNVYATYQIFLARLRTYSRYKGQVIMSVLMPIMIASLPILMGTGLGGANAVRNFQTNTKITSGSFQGYLLIGALLMQLTSNTLWNFGFWLRREQTTGTLESGVYLVPTSKPWMLLGSSAYVLVRNSASFILALILGVIIFSIQANEFLNTTLILGVFFLLLGLPSLIGLSLLFGSLILKFKETGTLINLIEFAISFLMGVFYPITVMPWGLQIIASLFPPTWTTNEIRSALYDVPYFLSVWGDIVVSLGFALIVPILAFSVFIAVERRILRHEGVGQF
ncbi:MAG TPA: ABC transporter permease [Candidatus Hodarchaeales archaeon]|nr:ABC transporter permease [Candidatus Hodarchaeales archaeon]